MGKNTYIVHFRPEGSVRVDAFTEAEARILAQAERIKAAKDYAIIGVEEVIKERTS
jgi:hypothetical protein